MPHALVPGSVADYVNRFSADFPFADEVLRLVQASTGSVIYAAPVHQAAPARSWALHIRLPGHLERHFGITRQLLVYCLCARDLQPRDVNRVQALIRDAQESLEPTLAMLVTADPDTAMKLEDWAVERNLGLIIIPADQTTVEELVTSDAANGLQTLIQRSIKSHNFYDERDPVTGDRFFGRGAMLRNLERQLASGRGHVGLFGLRRIGKTSLILELRDRLRKRPSVIPIFIDLEATSNVAHAAYRLIAEFTKELALLDGMSQRQAERALQPPEDWASIDPQELIARFADTARGVLTGAMRDHHVVLLMDEAEVLLPSPTEPAEHAVDLFRAIRGVSQETQRLSLVLAGVNATPTESPMLGTQDNPLFGLLSVEYLGPLETAECDEMIRRVGRKMQVRWDGPGVSVLTKAVGAHPLLARLAASDVVTHSPERPLRPTIQDVDQCLSQFHITQSSIFEQMVQSLRRYYPDELELLKWISIGEADVVREVTHREPSLLNHLAGYGVVDQDSLTISIPAFDRWLFLQQDPT